MSNPLICAHSLQAYLHSWMVSRPSFLRLRSSQGVNNQIELSNVAGSHLQLESIYKSLTYTVALAQNVDIHHIFTYVRTLTILSHLI